MKRFGPRLLTLAAFGLALCAARPAAAFHAVDTFSLPASQGGGGILYYTGSPRLRRWDCGACHLDAPGEISIFLRSAPAELIEQGVYDPGAVYDITVEMGGQTRGLESAANYNTFALEIIDGALEPVQGFFGYDENYLRVTPAQDVIFARGQKNEDVTSWTFKWSAPEAGTGFVDLHVAMVDGNGAESPGSAQGDPLGDDVAVGALRIAERDVPAPPMPVPQPTEASCRSLPVQDGLLLLVPGALALVMRRRRARV